LASELRTAHVGGAATAEGGAGAVALFTNPLRVWKEYSRPPVGWGARISQRVEYGMGSSGTSERCPTGIAIPNVQLELDRR
ncbi:hypothetical protein F441_18346, partial [Phytophthora nicotianae CJ01A1]